MIRTVIAKIAAVTFAVAALTTLAATTAHADAGTTSTTVVSSDPWE